MCAWWSRPEWWTAIGTVALVLVTGLTVLLGGIAARTALSTLKLESEPALAFSDSGTPANRTLEDIGGRTLVRDPNQWYIVERADGDAKALVFRRALDGDVDKSQSKPPGSYLEIKNIGRSPAVGVTITINVKADTLNIVDGKPVPDEISGKGNMVVHVLAPNDSVYVGISNKLGVPVKLHPSVWGTRAAWNDPGAISETAIKTKPIPVLSMTFVYQPFVGQ